MFQYGCPACHVIPHVPGAVGKVGPSLASVSERSYLAGSLPNTPENLEHWIMHPQNYQPRTAMPEMGVSEQDAHRIASFLDSEP
jgi:cytochrome c2